jgi:hypothetical protein
MNPDLEFGALQKPLKGDSRNARHETKLERKGRERKAMDEARRRDRGCRWPGCDCHAKKRPVHVCHRVHRGQGGNPAGDRTRPEILISLCDRRHRMWDLGLIDVTPQDEAVGFNGAADFSVRNEAGQFDVVASEKVIGVSAARS